MHRLTVAIESSVFQNQKNEMKETTELVRQATKKLDVVTELQGQRDKLSARIKKTDTNRNIDQKRSENEF